MDKDFDIRMMRRALQLARMGYGFVSPNPMVGAVVTDDSGRVVGEGFHRKWGTPHAEVNAIASVINKSILPQCTVYVTLEPCAHYGKTPPCAKLLIDSDVKRVVIGCPDPFKEVSGRGTAMLRDAGIDVTENVCRDECEALNRKFIYAHTHRRPYVLLKWAQSADGFVAAADGSPIALSNAVSLVFMHRIRAGYDAIMTGTHTLNTDNPALTCRLWPHRLLRPVVFDTHGNVAADRQVLSNPDTIIIREPVTLSAMLDELYASYGVTSLMVEGGPTLLKSFIEEELWNEIRVEIAPCHLNEGIKAPLLPAALPSRTEVCGGNQIVYFVR